jgi:hypothetical protein
MYESQVRPQTKGRKLVVLQHPGSRFYINAFQSLTILSKSSIGISAARQFAALWLLSGCLAIISGCGGLSYSKSTQGNSVTLSEISCGSQSLTGPQSKACSLSLTAAALTATTVQLSSSNPALKVPGEVKIAVGQTSANFDAVTSAVSKAATVTITATFRGKTKTAAVTLYPATAGAPTLTSLSCAAQSLTGPTTTACSVHLASSTTSPIAVALSSSSSAIQIPQAVTITAGSATADFKATASSVANAQKVTLTASSAGVTQTYLVNLVSSSTQASQPHKVQLSWSAPGTSAATIVGYNIYRAVAGVSTYALLSSLDAQTSYTDTGVQSGSTYNYVVKSVDSKGAESTPSNSTQVTIP